MGAINIQGEGMPSLPLAMGELLKNSK